MAILGNNVKGPTSTGTVGGRKYVSKFTLAAPATLTELHGWFGGTGATIQIVIYADSGGLPGARVAFTAPLTPTGGDVELQQVGFSVALPAGTYWIGWASQNAGTVTAYYDGTIAGGAHQAQTTGAAYNPPSDPFGTPDNSGARTYSCWAVVTAGPPSTVARFSRLKVGSGLKGADLGAGVIQVDALTVSGTGPPAAGVGVDGAVYLDRATGRLYGPKAAGAWPATAFGRLLLPGNTYADVAAQYGNYAALLAG